MWRFVFGVGFIFLLMIENNLAYALTKNQAINFFHLSPQHSIVFLDIKGSQQNKDYTCGPAVVMSLLNYYGKLSDKELTAGTEQRIEKEMGTTQEEGSDEVQIVCWLRKHGFNAQVYYNGSLKQIRKYLARGIPVLVDWIDWGGHWVAVAGYDSARTHDFSQDTIFFADSAAQFDNIKTRDGITYFNAERFASMWFSSNHCKNIYIVATPINTNAP